MKRQAVLVTLVAALVRLFYAAWIPLFPDETYYWDWSRHLAGGYFDHPPMIAVLIRAGTLAFGDSSLAIRFFPVLAGLLASLAAVGIAERIGGDAAARLAAWSFALMPLAASGLVLATPDAPLLAASAVALFGVVRAIQAPPSSAASLRWWIAAGIALGLAFSSKYTSILLPLTIVVALLTRRSLRVRLAEPGPWVACIVATIVFLPVLRWNAAHDWISFRFQLQHGLGAPKGSAIKRELDLVGGQLGLVSPILFALAALAVWRTLRRPAADAAWMLAVVATGSWVFFAWSALRRPVEANWPAPSYVPGLALLAAHASTPAWDRWVKRALALAAVLVGVLYLHALVPVLPLRASRDPVARGAGWARVGRMLPAEVRGRTWFGADRYQDVSEVAYQLPGHTEAFCMCLGGRHNQYELWPGFAQRAQVGDNLVLVLDDTPANEVHVTAQRLTPYFASVERGPVAPLLRGTDTVSVRRVWRLSGYRGGWPARAEP